MAHPQRFLFNCYVVGPSIFKSPLGDSNVQTALRTKTEVTQTENRKRNRSPLHYKRLFLPVVHSTKLLVSEK